MERTLRAASGLLHLGARPGDRSARWHLGVCCKETCVLDNETERVSRLLFCQMDFCNEVSAAVASLSLVDGTVN